MLGVHQQPVRDDVAKKKRAGKPRPKGKGGRQPARAGKPARPEPTAPRPTGTPAPGKPEVVVGIGASAGGLATLGEFFRHVAPGSGLAYVVVVHLGS